MRLSLCYISHRPGSIDLLADSLRQQTVPAGLEWELIVIDGCPGRVQRGEAEAYLRSLNIPVRHYGLPKMHTFPWARTGFANAHNTGLIYSSGTHVVFLNDFCWFPLPTVELWAKAFTEQPDTLLCGVGITYTSPKPDALIDRDGQSALHDVATWKSLDMRRDWAPASLGFRSNSIRVIGVAQLPTSKRRMVLTSGRIFARNGRPLASRLKRLCTAIDCG